MTVSGDVDPEILLKKLRKKANKSAELLSSEGGNENDPSDFPPENNAYEEEEADEADGGGENGVNLTYIPMIHLGPPGYLQEGIPAPPRFLPPNTRYTRYTRYTRDYRRPPVHYTDPCTSMFSDENPNACSIM